MKKFKQMYRVPFSAFIGFIGSKQKEVPTVKQALKIYNTRKNDFVNYIIKTSDIKNIKDTKIVVDLPIL